MPCSTSRSWQRDSNETASEELGAVHIAFSRSLSLLISVRTFQRYNRLARTHFRMQPFAASP